MWQEAADLIVTSALRRTLQTTLRTWGSAVERLGIENVICLPEAQECLDFPCDCGSSKEELEQDPEFTDFDFSRLTPGWNTKTGFWASDPRSIANRTKWVRQFLRDRPEKNIVLVAHGDFLREITCDASGPSTYMWGQVEIQMFKFDDNTVRQDECYLVSAEASREAQGRMYTMLGKDRIREIIGRPSTPGYAPGKNNDGKI